MDYSLAIDPKTLRETLCTAQAIIGNSLHVMPDLKMRHLVNLQILIDECDRHRPLGSDGKHGNRHTSTCECLDKYYGKEEDNGRMEAGP